MKKLLIITMLFSVCLATPKKKINAELNDCQEALQKMMLSNGIVYDTIFVQANHKKTRKDVKIAKQLVDVAKIQAKTERKESTNEKHQIIAELKTIKAIELSEDKVELKTSAIYQFGSSFKALLRSLNISQALGLGGGVLGGLMGLLGFAEKFKPISKFIGLFKKE